jgi:hypothetical protein
MRENIRQWTMQKPADSMIDDAINTAINEIWQNAALAGFTNFLGVREVTIDVGMRGTFIVSVPNPTDPPVMVVDDTAATQLPDRQPWFQFTWVSVFGGETQPSPSTDTIAPAGSSITSVGLPADIIIPDFAERWNLYRDGLLVTPEPLDFNIAWTEADYVPPVNPRGIPVKNSTSDEIMWIEGAGVTMPNGTYYRWPNAPLDSLVWQRAQRTRAFGREPTGYAWNMAAGNFIAISSPATQVLKPDLLYLRRPPKLTEDGDMIPFPAFDAEPFIRAASLALISKALNEWSSAAAWDAEAAKEKQLVLRMQIRANRPKYVTPYRI